MEFIKTALAFALTIGILVTFHEFGHFWVARRCGVKVLRFSIGFGKPLLMWVDRHGTEFAIAAIPLGGYVRMLDEREGEVPADQLSFAFNRKSVAQRTAIVAAGPIANFVFAVVAYWILFVAGFSALAPYLGPVEADTPASHAGLQEGMEIVNVDGIRTDTWQAVALTLLNRIGDSGEIRLDVSNQGTLSAHVLPIADWLVSQDTPEPLRTLGFQPWRPVLEPIIGRLEEGGAADLAGLHAGDRVIAVNGVPVATWMAVVEHVRAAPGMNLDLDVERDGVRLLLHVIPAPKVAEDGVEIGFIGAGVKQMPWPEQMIRHVRYGPGEAVAAAIRQTGKDVELTLMAIKKMVMGMISVKNLSGPITIARAAEESVSSGYEEFLRFLAYISVSLGVLNLLPIPVLDGGHLLYYAIEAVRRKPLTEAQQAFGLRLGLTLILGLMMVALYNDLLRL